MMATDYNFKKWQPFKAFPMSVDMLGAILCLSKGTVPNMTYSIGQTQQNLPDVGTLNGLIYFNEST